jgi:tripartite-type tricarboxylate transporter receptor subunit TctC
MTSIGRRQFLGYGSAMSAIFPMAPALADEYPSKPIRIITPNSAGSSVDNLARRVGDHLSHAWGISVIVDNTPGAGGIIGTEKLIASPADGYTIAVVATNHIILPHVNSAVRYDALAQITPVCTILDSCGVVAARPGFPAKTAGELITYAKANPGKLNFGTSGVGTSVDLSGRLLQKIGGIDVVNVPYRGVSTLVPDLRSGAVDVAVFGLSAVSGLIRAGSLVGLGITRRERLAMFPDIPPISESVPTFRFSGWFALLAPVGLSSAITKKLADEIGRLQADRAFIDAAARDGDVPLVMSGTPLKNFMEEESKRIAALVKSANIKIS